MPQIPQLQIPQLGAVSGGVDFAPLGQLGQIYQKRQQDEANKAAIAAFQQTGDTRALLGSGDMSLIKLGTEMERQKTLDARQARQETRQTAQDALQVDRYRVEDAFKDRELKQKAEVLAGKGEKPAASEMKSVDTAQNEIPAIDSTIANVKRALELNPKVYSGFGAGIRGELGSKGPGWIPDAIASPEKGAATVEWEQLMGEAAIKNMSDTLKGASTEFEMRKFLSIAADVSKDVETRKRAMERVLTLAEAEKGVRQKRLDFMQKRYPSYYKPEGGTAAPAPQAGPQPGTVQDGYRFKGGNPADQVSWEKVTP